MNRNLLTGRWSALTGACLLTRKKDFQDLGGLDEVLFPVTFNDVDYCLRLEERNKASVLTPHARFFHEESASRGKDDSPAKKVRARREMAHLRDKWGDRLLNDPYYNPNLELSACVEVFDGLALPPRTRSIR
jgi:GT2 family glycosyltransferase